MFQHLPFIYSIAQRCCFTCNQWQMQSFGIVSLLPPASHILPRFLFSLSLYLSLIMRSLQWRHIEEYKKLFKMKRKIKQLQVYLTEMILAGSLLLILTKINKNR